MKKRTFVVLIVAAMVSGAVAAVAAYSQSRTGELTGAIYLVGGPALPSGISSCHGTRYPGRGPIRVRDARGAVISGKTTTANISCNIM